MTKNDSKIATNKITKIAIFLVLIIISGMIAIPVPAIGVPFVLQNMLIMMAGGFLGKKYGTLTVGIFLLASLLGLPFLSGGRGGVGLLFSPGSGFLLGFLLCPLTISLLLEKLGTRNLWCIIIAYIIGGAVLIDLMGSISLAYYSHTSWLTGIAMASIYLPIDLVKAVLASVIHQRLKKETYFEEMHDSL